MKVAYFVNQYPKVSHSFIRREVAALERQGVQIERIALSTNPDELVDSADRIELDRTVLLKKIPIHQIMRSIITVCVRQIKNLPKTLMLMYHLGRRSHRGMIINIAYFFEACLLADIVFEKSVQHIHAHFGTNSTSIAMLASAMTGVPYSFTAHGPDEFDQPVSLCIAEKVARAKFVATVSSFGRSQMLRWVSYRHWSKVKVVHCGVDETFLASTCDPVPDNNNLICVGRLSGQKGQLLLIDAMAQLKQDGTAFHLTLAGDGEMRDDIESLINKWELNDHITITGWVSSVDVRQLIEQSRALILPSFMEGLPVVLMEALARGRPVICTYIAGNPELVQPGVSGWLVPAGSARAIARAAQQVLETPIAELTAMAECGRELVRAEHSIDKEAEKLFAFFQSSSVATT